MVFKPSPLSNIFKGLFSNRRLTPIHNKHKQTNKNENKNIYYLQRILISTVAI
jgi:hypothetical protein